MPRRRTPNQRESRDLCIESQSAVEHLLEHRPDRIREILFSVYASQNKRLDHLRELARQNQIPVHSFEPRDRTLVRANLAPYVYGDFGNLMEKAEDWDQGILLALDHLQDPQNFGALLRTAEALGAKGVLLPKDRSVTVSSGVYHASVGAVDTVDVIQVTNLADSLKKLKDKGFWVVGTLLGEDATSPWEMPDYEKIIWVMGSELDGISSSIEKLLDWKIQIPLTGKVQSLNVSVAGAICMYESYRRQQKSQKS